MKITKTSLKELINEEINRLLSEQEQTLTAASNDGVMPEQGYIGVKVVEKNGRHLINFSFASSQENKNIKILIGTIKPKSYTYMDSSNQPDFRRIEQIPKNVLDIGITKAVELANIHNKKIK